VIADIVPVVIGYSSLPSASILGSDLRYLADAAPVLAVCAGLAFLPTTGEDNAYRARLPAVRSRAVASALLAAAFFIGSLWSIHTYQAAASGEAARSYIATARAAAQLIRPGAVILDAPVPATVMTPAFFGRDSFASKVLAPLFPGRARVHWTRTPTGVIGNLMLFDGRGRLWPATVVGASSLPAPGKRGCWRIGFGPRRIPLSSTLYRWSWTVQLWYTGPAARLALWFGGRWQFVTLPAGHHDAYVPAIGAGSSIVVQALNPVPGSCLSQLVAGTVQPSGFGQPVPAVPVP
jgi:hypothetical protein